MSLLYLISLRVTLNFQEVSSLKSRRSQHDRAGSVFYYILYVYSYCV